MHEKDLEITKTCVDVIIFPSKLKLSSLCAALTPNRIRPDAIKAEYIIRTENRTALSTWAESPAVVLRVSNILSAMKQPTLYGGNYFNGTS